MIIWIIFCCCCAFAKTYALTEDETPELVIRVRRLCCFGFKWWTVVQEKLMIFLFDIKNICKSQGYQLTFTSFLAVTKTHSSLRYMKSSFFFTLEVKIMAVLKPFQTEWSFCLCCTEMSVVSHLAVFWSVFHPEWMVLTLSSPPAVASGPGHGRRRNQIGSNKKWCCIIEKNLRKINAMFKQLVNTSWPQYYLVVQVYQLLLNIMHFSHLSKVRHQRWNLKLSCSTFNVCSTTTKTQRHRT